MLSSHMLVKATSVPQAAISTKAMTAKLVCWSFRARVFRVVSIRPMRVATPKAPPAKNSMAIRLEASLKPLKKDRKKVEMPTSDFSAA